MIWTGFCITLHKRVIIMKAYRFLLIAATVAAAAVSCHKQDRPQRQSGGGNDDQQGREQQVVTLKENATWSIDYGGRQTIKENNVDKTVEVIEVSNVPANTLYLVSVINQPNLASYNGDYKSFFDNELEAWGEYVYTGPETIYFDPLRHGQWYAFIIAIDSDNKLTGEYAYRKFTIDEEEPTEGFLKWIGNWAVTDGRITYNLKVTSQEANFVYRVDGWEVFEGAIEQMDKEYLETFYDNGDMYFISQYITTYTEDGEDVDECFLGEIYFDEIQEGVSMDWYIITDENIDLACARLKGDDSAVLNPCRITAVMGNKDFETEFYDMKYFHWSSKTGWVHYNDPQEMGHEALTFKDPDTKILQPVTMTRVEESPAPTAIGRRGNVREEGAKALRGRVHKAKTQRATAIRAK